MELDINIVLNIALEKIQELEKDLICEKAATQQLLQKVEELNNILNQKENKEDNE